MKITRRDINKTIALILESEEQKKKFREKAKTKLINSLEKINVIKKKESEAKSAVQADANKPEEEKELPSNKKPEEGSVDYEAILALEQLALTFKNNEKAEQIIDGKKITVVDFVGILKGMEAASPEFFKACMEKPTIKEVYEKHKDKVNTPDKEDADSSKVPSDKTGQIKYIQKAVGEKEDGNWGKNTDTKWINWIISDDVIKAIQKISGESTPEEPGESPSEPMESDPETGEESPDSQANESINRLQLRNLLETMAYFPYLNEDEQDDEPGESDNTDDEPGESDNTDAIADITAAAERMKNRSDQASQASSDDADTPKKKNKSNKSAPKQYDDMGLQGKAAFVAKNRGNAAAIAKHLGYKPTLDGVTKLVKDILNNGGKAGAKPAAPDSKTSKTKDDTKGETFKVKDPFDDNQEILIPKTLSNLYGVFKSKEKTINNDSTNLTPSGKYNKYYYYFADANGNSLKDNKPLVMKTKNGELPFTKLQNANVLDSGTRVVNFNSKFTGTNENGGLKNNSDSESSEIKHITNELPDGKVVFLGQYSKKRNLTMRTDLLHDEETAIVVVYYYPTSETQNESKKHETKKLFETLLKYGIIG